MIYMFEVYYRTPADPDRERDLARRVAEFGGRLDYREDPGSAGRSSAVCLTYEFDTWSAAEAAADALRGRGEHVEGPQDYGA